jgi:hypothetical protein
MRISPKSSTCVCLKGGLTMFCNLIKEKTYIANVRKLVYYFPKIIGDLKFNQAIGKFRIYTSTLKSRITGHRKNWQTNEAKFNHLWDKQFTYIMEFKDYQIGTSKIPEVDFGGYIRFFNEDFRKTVFGLIYNLRLVKWIQDRNAKKEKDKLEKSKNIAGLDR